MAPLWLTLLHVTSVSLWSGGLVALPLLLLRRAASAGVALRSRHAARMVYLAVICPSAVLAVLTGTALAARTSVAPDWLHLKLWLVAGMALMHVLAARRIDGSFGGFRPPAALLRASASVAGGLAVAILLVGFVRPPLPDPANCLGPDAAGLVVQASVMILSCGMTAGP